MEQGTLIFIPYQDTDNFYSDGILTREFAMLYLLRNMGFTNIINVKKPRTSLDTPRYIIHEDYYPKGTIEFTVKEYCDLAKTIQYKPIVSIKQIMERRCWWSEGYIHNKEKLLNEIIPNKSIVYSDNPFASQLLEILHNNGAVIYFDIMDNFAIHPSLSQKEHNGALQGYKSIMQFADIVSANSLQTCEYMQHQTGRKIILVKNGVFKQKPFELMNDLPVIKKIRNKKRSFKKCVGYIGKLGGRLDADLIDSISSVCSDTLFVFVGNYLKDQINKKLLSLFASRNNVLQLSAVPSAYVYAVMNEFDILSIPHAVGKAENGGDPLKLYQYLIQNKPIITTNILGVSEFQNTIKITNDASEWVSFIKKNDHTIKNTNVNFLWDYRMEPVRKEIEECSRFHL